MKRRKAAKGKTKTTQPGFDGAKTSTVEIRISHDRTARRSVRAKPGTFEWRYGRGTADGALYHAGVHFAVLWEKAGAADARSPDFAMSGGGGWKGLPDSRVSALDSLRGIVEELEKRQVDRLASYCVRGQSVSEIAAAYEVPKRDMSAVIHQDLRSLAFTLRYL